MIVVNNGKLRTSLALSYGVFTPCTSSARANRSPKPCRQTDYTARACPQVSAEPSFSPTECPRFAEAAALELSSVPINLPP
jgi:hypothetical protein